MNLEKKKLVWNAVPTLFKVSKKPSEIILKRQLPTKNVSPKKLKVSKSWDAFDTVPERPTSRIYVHEVAEIEINKLKKIIDDLRRQSKYKSAEILNSH